jgi:hypothetical protein
MSTLGITTPTGPALDGEVEDYKVTLVGAEFQNGISKFDVNNDTHVNATDVLIVINFINFFKTQLIDPINGTMSLPITSPPYMASTVTNYSFTGLNGGAPGDGRFVDVDGNGILNAIDVLNVINELNSPTFTGGSGEGAGEGEGEGPAALAASPLTSAPAVLTAASQESKAGPLQLSAPAVVYASSSVVFEQRPTDVQSLSDDESWDTDASDALDLAILAHSPGQSSDDVGLALSLNDAESLPVGPLDEQSWDDLLSGLAADQESRPPGDLA